MKHLQDRLFHIWTILMSLFGSAVTVQLILCAVNTRSIISHVPYKPVKPVDMVIYLPQCREKALTITPEITKLFNISITLGELPEEWRTARGSPIPKSNDKTNASKYRPISILSKVLEFHVRDILVDRLEHYHPLSEQQWGFVKHNQPRAVAYLVRLWYICVFSFPSLQ